jgi:hypothetical protein
MTPLARRPSASTTTMEARPDPGDQRAAGPGRRLLGQRQRLLPWRRLQGRVRPNDPGTSYASVSDYGLYRRLAGESSYSRIYTIQTPGASATSSLNRVEFDATDLGGKTASTSATRRSTTTRSGPPPDRRRDGPVGLLDDAQQPEQVVDGLRQYNFCQGQCVRHGRHAPPGSRTPCCCPGR